MEEEEKCLVLLKEEKSQTESEINDEGEEEEMISYSRMKGVRVGWDVDLFYVKEQGWDGVNEGEGGDEGWLGEW